MNRLSAFVRTRRKLVLITWLLLVVASVPLMSQQTKHLTSGGFEVPGSGSSEVDNALSRFHHEQGEGLGIVLQGKGGDLLRRRRPRRGGGEADRARRGRARSRAGRQAGRRAAGGRGHPARRQRRRRRHPPGRQGPARGAQGRRGRRRRPGLRRRPAGAVGGHAGAPEGGPRARRGHRLPGDPDRAPGRVRHRARRAAAGRAGRRRRGRDRRDHLPAQPRDDDVGVRHEHHLDARHRRGRGLQPVRAEPLPRGGRRGQGPRRARWTPPCAPPARPSSSPA